VSDEKDQFDNLPTTPGPMPSAGMFGMNGAGVPATRTDADIISREIATIQGKIATAKYFPRDLVKTQQRVQAECERPTMAEMAEYAYPRGNTTVVGPTVSLIRMIARNMGNIEYGWRVVHKGEGHSDVEARVWDMENNVSDSRTFRVLHVRETRSGNIKLTSPRDIYELVANMAARRVRSLLSEIIPAYIVEDARETCKKTLARDGKNLTREQRVEALAKAFRSAAVSVEMVEIRLGHKMADCSEEEIEELRAIYASLREKATTREDWFEVGEEKKKTSEPDTATLDPAAKPKQEVKPEPPEAPREPKPKAKGKEPAKPQAKPVEQAPAKQETPPARTPAEPSPEDVPPQEAGIKDDLPPFVQDPNVVKIGPCKYVDGAYYVVDYCEKSCFEKDNCPAYQKYLEGLKAKDVAESRQEETEQAKAEKVAEESAEKNKSEMKDPLDMTQEEMEAWRKSSKGMNRRRHTEQPPGDEKWFTAGITRPDYLFLRAIPEGHPARGLIDKKLASIGYYYEPDGLTFLREPEGVSLAKAVRLVISGEEE